MKALILSLLLCIGMAGKSQYNYAPEPTCDFDTTKYQISLLPKIYNSIYDSFSDNEVRSLVIYADSTIIVINVLDSTHVEGNELRSVDAFKIIQDYISKTKFCCFKMAYKAIPTRNSHVIYVRLFVFPENEKYGTDIYFEISQTNKIITIAIQ